MASSASVVMSAWRVVSWVICWVMDLSWLSRRAAAPVGAWLAGVWSAAPVVAAHPANASSTRWKSGPWPGSPSFPRPDSRRCFCPRGRSQHPARRTRRRIRVWQRCWCRWFSSYLSDKNYPSIAPLFIRSNTNSLTTGTLTAFPICL